MKYAYFTLASDEYVDGVVCLAKSLHKNSKNSQLHVINIDMSDDSLKRLKNLRCDILCPPYLTSKTCKPQSYRENKNFAHNCFNKFHIWNQEFDKIIYLDADTIVIKNIDHLFDLNCVFAAGSKFSTTYVHGRATSAEWLPSLFNAGVLVIKPDKKTYEELLLYKDTVETPDDPSDQGLLNYYFADRWHRLHPIYNFTKRVYDVSPSTFKQLKKDICVLHYTLDKPWKQKTNNELNDIWWNIYEN